MSIYVTLLVKAYSAVDTVRLRLCLKTKCAVLNGFDRALEIGIVTKEVADIELNTGLIGVYRHLKLLAAYLSRKTKLLAVKVALYGRRENEIMVVSYKLPAYPLTDSVRLCEVEYRALNVGAVTIWNLYLTMKV